MKILQIIYSLALGGAERFVVDLSNELSKKENDVTLLTLRDDNDPHWGFYKKSISQDIEYLNYSITPGFRPVITKILYKEIKRTKPDIVHCHQGILYYLLPIVPLFKNVKFYYTVHSDASKEFQSKLEKKIRTFCFKKNIIRAITISKDTSESFEKCFETNNYTQIENGRNKDELSTLSESVGTEIESLKRNADDKVFIHVGRCDYPKNQDLLIDVFNQLLEEKEKLILIIVGNGFDSEKGLELQKKATPGIYFLGPKQNVGDYLFFSDAFCLTSIYEGLPISLLEALSFGCIPICTPVGGIVNVVKDGVTGYLAESASEESYLRAVKRYIANPKEINKETVISHFNKNYSIEICADKHVDLYK